MFRSSMGTMLTPHFWANWVVSSSQNLWSPVATWFTSSSLFWMGTWVTGSCCIGYKYQKLLVAIMSWTWPDVSFVFNRFWSYFAPRKSMVTRVQLQPHNGGAHKQGKHLVHVQFSGLPWEVQRKCRMLLALHITTWDPPRLRALVHPSRKFARLRSWPCCSLFRRRHLFRIRCQAVGQTLLGERDTLDHSWLECHDRQVLVGRVLRGRVWVPSYSNKGWTLLLNQFFNFWILWSLTAFCYKLTSI